MNIPKLIARLPEEKNPYDTRSIHINLFTHLLRPNEGQGVL